ncbi:winged helix-turn-helix domain-containing protein [Streptomyces sp. NPDC059928]|uniref:winged helix-turn-helix domain-containing protein n=1 Tax=unclassified Streptomyces TaxID=2593676 RepID=UPI0036627347
MLRRHGWSHRAPAKRAFERDEQKVTGWVKDTWPQVETPRRRSGPSSSLKTRPGSRWPQTAHRSQARRPAQLHVDRLLRSADRCPHAARDLAGSHLGQPECAPGRPYASLHRRPDWIASLQLPSYAPDLNPVEGIWSLIRRSGQCNAAFTDPDHLIRVLRRRLRELQYRPDLLDGCLAATGLTLTTSRPQSQ